MFPIVKFLRNLQNASIAENVLEDPLRYSVLKMEFCLIIKKGTEFTKRAVTAVWFNHHGGHVTKLMLRRESLIFVCIKGPLCENNISILALCHGSLGITGTSNRKDLRKTNILVFWTGTT